MALCHAVAEIKIQSNSDTHPIINVNGNDMCGAAMR